jgi:hypothetical protein
MVGPLLSSAAALQQIIAQQAGGPAVPLQPVQAGGVAPLQMGGQPQPVAPEFPGLTANQRAMATRIANDMQAPAMALLQARMAMNVQLQLAAQNNAAVPIAQKQQLEAAIATANTNYNTQLENAGAAALLAQARAGVQPGAAIQITPAMQADLVAAQNAVNAIIQREINDGANININQIQQLMQQIGIPGGMPGPNNNNVVPPPPPGAIVPPPEGLPPRPDRQSQGRRA